MRVPGILAALVLASAGVSAEAAEITGKARVLDGDTIAIAGQRIRLFGIDAPESDQTCTADGEEWACGRDAAYALAFAVGRHWVRCETEGADARGEVVAVCRVGAHDLAAKMVREGWALASRAVSGAYVEDEKAARRSGRGIWRGRFVAPWLWRGSAGRKPSAFTLALKGTRGVAYSADCSLTTGQGTRQFQRRGVVPEIHEFRAYGLACRFSKLDAEGTLAVEISKNGTTVSHSSTTAKGGVIAVSLH